MASHWQKNSNCRSDNPSHSEKNGKIFKKDLLGKITYLNSIEKKHLISEGVSLRNIRTEVHGAIIPKLPPVAHPDFKKHSEAISQKITEALIEYTEEAKRLNPKAGEVPEVWAKEFISIFYNEDFDWIESEEAKAFYMCRYAEEVLEELCGTNRFYTLNTHLEKTKEDEKGQTVSHNGHVHCTFSTVNELGQNYFVARDNLALRAANTAVEKKYKYRFKFVPKGNGYVKEYLLDSKGEKIPFVTQVGNGRNLQIEVENLELHTSKSIEDFETEIALIMKHDLTNMSELNELLTKIGLTACSNSKGKKVRGKYLKNEVFDEVVLQSIENKQLLLKHRMFSDELYQKLDRLGQQDHWEYKNGKSIRHIRDVVHQVLHSLPEKPTYNQLNRALEEHGLLLSPKIKTQKNTGKKYVEGGSLSFIEEDIGIRLSWIPNFQWKTVQSLLAIQEEELIQEIENEEARRVEAQRYNSIYPVIVSKYTYDYGSIEEWSEAQQGKKYKDLLDYQIVFKGNVAFYKVNQNKPAFTVLDNNTIVSDRNSLSVAKLMLLTAQRSGSASVEVSGDLEFMRNAYIASQLLKEPIEVTFKNQWTPDTVTLDRLGGEVRKERDKLVQQNSRKIDKEIGKNPAPSDRVVTLSTHWNLEVVKFEGVIKAVNSDIYRFRNYKPDEILADKDKILAVATKKNLSPEKVDHLKAFFLSLETDKAETELKRKAKNKPSKDGNSDNKPK
tara:strand:+ start:16724 stop:18898 length:2175 start_codon:yes stop_codon:yes gene_type:complete